MHDIPDWVGRYVGIPFLDYGRDQLGSDCWGLASLIWKEQCGLDLPGNDVDPNRGDLIEVVAKENLKDWFLIDAGQEREFDGVYMTGIYGDGRNLKRAAMHVGVVVRPGVLIHTTEETGSSVLMSYLEPRARNDIIAFYRHRRLFQPWT